MLNGNRVNLLGDIVNRSVNSQTINLDLVLDGSTRSFNATNGNIIVNCVISQSGGTQGLIKTGSHTLVLAGNTPTKARPKSQVASCAQTTAPGCRLSAI